MGTNSGPSGRKLRWYPMRALANAMGKHGLAKLRDRMNLPPLHTSGGYRVTPIPASPKD